MKNLFYPSRLVYENSPDSAQKYEDINSNRDVSEAKKEMTEAVDNFKKEFGKYGKVFNKSDINKAYENARQKLEDNRITMKNVLYNSTDKEDFDKFSTEKIQELDDLKNKYLHSVDELKNKLDETKEQCVAEESSALGLLVNKTMMNESNPEQKALQDIAERLDNGEDIITMSTPDGIQQYIKGSNGNIYRANNDGSYTKFIKGGDGKYQGVSMNSAEMQAMFSTMKLQQKGKIFFARLGDFLKGRDAKTNDRAADQNAEKVASDDTPTPTPETPKKKPAPKKKTEWQDPFKKSSLKEAEKNANEYNVEVSNDANVYNSYSVDRKAVGLFIKGEKVKIIQGPIEVSQSDNNGGVSNDKFYIVEGIHTDLRDNTKKVYRGYMLAKDLPNEGKGLKPAPEKPYFFKDGSPETGVTITFHGNKNLERNTKLITLFGDANKLEVTDTKGVTRTAVKNEKGNDFVYADGDDKGKHAIVLEGYKVKVVKEGEQKPEEEKPKPEEEKQKPEEAQKEVISNEQIKEMAREIPDTIKRTLKPENPSDIANVYNKIPNLARQDLVSKIASACGGPPTMDIGYYETGVLLNGEYGYENDAMVYTIKLTPEDKIKLVKAYLKQHGKKVAES